MPTFFGITNRYQESVHKQFHAMKYYGGWSLWELFNLPVGLRNYYASLLEETLKTKIEEERKATAKSKKGRF